MKTVDQVQGFYEDKYSAISNYSVNKREIELYRKYWALIDQFINEKLNRSHLDIGCAEGNKTYAVHSFNFKTTAIDLSEFVIEQGKKIWKDSSIDFQSGDAFKFQGKFDVITAFGFSMFNVKNVQLKAERINQILSNNLNENKNSFMVVGSMTDYSGKGEDSWYYHTKNELDTLLSELKGYGYKVEIIFPYKKLSNYIAHGFYNFVAETYKLLFKKKKYYFIKIYHG